MSKTIKQRHLEAIVKEAESYYIGENEKAAEKCEAITEKIAIEFLVWTRNDRRTNNHSASELWELFKKETGL